MFVIIVLEYRLQVNWHAAKSELNTADVVCFYSCKLHFRNDKIARGSR